MPDVFFDSHTKFVETEISQLESLGNKVPETAAKCTLSQTGPLVMASVLIVLVRQIKELDAPGVSWGLFQFGRSMNDDDVCVIQILLLLSLKLVY